MIRPVLRSFYLVACVALGGCFVSDYKLFDHTKGVEIPLDSGALSCLVIQPRNTSPHPREARVTKVSETAPFLYDISDLLYETEKGANGSAIASMHPVGNNKYLAMIEPPRQNESDPKVQVILILRVDSSRIEVMFPDNAARVAPAFEVQLEGPGAKEAHISSMKGTKEQQLKYLYAMANSKELRAYVSCHTMG